VARSFVDLLEHELQIVRPTLVIPMGGLVSSLLLRHPFRLSVASAHVERTGSAYVAGQFGRSMVVPSYFPVGRGSPTKARAILQAV